jgi:hypothetical protein
LESAIGIRLFDRHTTGCVLTAAGDRFSLSPKSSKRSSKSSRLECSLSEANHARDQHALLNHRQEDEVPLIGKVYKYTRTYARGGGCHDERLSAAMPAAFASARAKTTPPGDIFGHQSMPYQ